MQYVTFTGGGMFSGLALMLDLIGHEATDRSIALAMEAPYLFVRTEDGYRAGTKLAQPQWLNLYLQPHGYRLHSEELAQKDIPAYLRRHAPALLRLRIQRGIVHPAVFSGYSDGRYHFINIKSAASQEPDTFSLSSASLKNRLDAQTEVWTITDCPAQPVNFVPLLTDSLCNLDHWLTEVRAVCQQPLTLAEFSALREALLRSLMQDALPLISLTGDGTLSEELRRLNHYYRHVFTMNSGDTVMLADRLPKRTILRCVEWLKEDIRDRLYELGAEEDMY